MAKKAFHQSKDQFLDEQCKYLFRMANEMKDDEHRFNFVHGHISAIEEGMKEGEQKKKMVKSMASWALKDFNAKEKYKTDLRMLDFWKFLGKYSSDLKMEGVMENLHRVGHFNTQPAFYLMWAEHWASLNNRTNFEKIMAMCENNCRISSFECADLFRPLSSKYLGDASDETDTMALIKVIADRPENVRRTLTIFTQQDQQQPVPASREEFSIFVPPKTQQQPMPSNREEFVPPKTPQVQQQPMPSNREEFVPPKTQQDQQQPVPASREEFSIFRDPAKSMLCGDSNDVTLSGAHGKFSHTVFTSTPRRSVAFCAFEPPMMEMDTGGLMGPSSPDNDNEERAGGLFAAAPEIGGSKLQRRLSLVGDLPVQSEKCPAKQNAGAKKMSANEIVKALPNLKIGSTILEETEEDEKENSLASPHRKKQRQAQCSSRPPSSLAHSKPQQDDASHRTKREE